MKKILYFEGAGCAKAPKLDNCRVRTAFHLDNGKAVFLEVIGIGLENIKGAVTHCFEISNEDTDSENHNRIKIRKDFYYNRKGITEIVNGLGASYDTIMVLSDLSGYKVFQEHNSWNYNEQLKWYSFADEFQYDPIKTKLREEIRDIIYKMEKEEVEKDLKEKTKKFVHSPSGRVYPCFDLWVDKTDFEKMHLVRHFNGFNKHWIIDTNKGSAAECVKGMKETSLGKWGC